MKILHLSSEKTWRGGEQQIAYLIEELNKAGIQNEVAVRKDSQFQRWCEQHSVEHFTLGFSNDFDIISALKLKKYCRKHKFDLLHLHSSRGHGIAFLSAWLGNNIPMILSRRVDFPIKNNFLTGAKYNHKGIRRIICVSEKVRQLVCQNVERRERCITIYDGVDLQRFSGKGKKGLIRSRYGIGEGEMLIGNVAALAPHKDHLTFLRTAALVAGQIPVKFLIIGEGPMRPVIEEEITKLNLQDKVILTGFLNDLENIYADLDALLFTSNEEGLGSSLLDAMACGVPIVATAAGGIPEIVRDGITGLLAPVGDASALAGQLTHLLTNPSLRNKIIHDAGEAVKNYSKEIMASKTLNVYDQVVSRKS